jgi:2'-hydroxyisoflavone reductase
MRLLILGGTLYLGRHLVEAAVARGHEVTLFNRGRTGPELFPGVERLRGDRDGDLGALAGRRWDAAIDLSGYLPAQVRAAAALLAPAIGRYGFISSISVYAESASAGLTEEGAVARLEPGAAEALSGESYGALKAACEAEVEALLPGRALVVRPGLIVGPHDATDRSAYWPRRVAEGGEVLAPGRPGRPVQLIDARDLAAWIVRLCEAGAVGVMNATGPGEALAMASYLDACRSVSGSDARFTWVDESFLLGARVAPYTELPLWVPEEVRAFGTVSIARARGAGLAFRPLAETLADILAWDRTQPPGPRVSRTRLPMPAGLSAEREQALLAAWREHCRLSSVVQ